MKNKNIFKKEKGFSLVEVLVGVFALVIIALSIYGGFHLSLKVIAQSKAKIGASAVVNQQMEMARNLSYEDIGTASGVPAGNLLQTNTTTLNGVDYTVETSVSYVDDDFDGVAPTDTLPNDYKRVKIAVSWDSGWGGSVSFMTDITPKGLETSVGGGNLLISVFDALGAPVSGADLHIVNNSVEPVINVTYQTNEDGQYLLVGAPESTEDYEITASKSEYSTERTYGVDEITTPDKNHASIIEGGLNTISFNIDQLSSFSIDTLAPWGSDSFTDSFADSSLISDSSSIVINSGQVDLSSDASGYVSPGYIISNEISPGSITDWDNFSFTDSKPDNTQITYQVLHYDGVNWVLIPDGDLAGNSTGLTGSPIDLSSLDSTAYPGLKVKANLATSLISNTPSLLDWQVSWKTSGSTIISNASFDLRGEKIIGTNASEDDVYKFESSFATNGSGHIDISDLEWDNYYFSINPATGLDLNSTDPATSPVGEELSLNPNTNQSVILYLEAANSLIVTVQDVDTATSIFGASVRLYGGGYDETLLTNEDGQVMFIPLDNGSYGLEISADSYDSYSGNTSVSSDDAVGVSLQSNEPS